MMKGQEQERPLTAVQSYKLLADSARQFEAEGGPSQQRRNAVAVEQRFMRYACRGMFFKSACTIQSAPMVSLSRENTILSEV